MNNFLKNTLWWIGLLALQLILLFYFRPTLVYTPYIYIVLLFRIPISFPKINLLLIAFFTGLLIDIFTNSLGIHAFAAVFIAYIFPYIASLLSHQVFNNEVAFTLKSMGYIRYGIALFLLFLTYHLLVLFLWNFSFEMLIHNILKAFVSSLSALLITFVIYSLLKPQKEEENG